MNRGMKETYGWLDTGMDGQSFWMCGQVIYIEMNEWMDGWMYQWIDCYLDNNDRYMDWCMNVMMVRWIDDMRDRCINVWII